MLRGSLVLSTCALAVLAALTPGCKGGECGTGTLRYGDTCVAVDPFDKTPPHVMVDPPLYTREVGTVRLTTDEPATIYYTIDGTSPTEASANEPDEVVIPDVPDNTQLRYFAVDLAGNRSPEELRIWIIDRSGPSAPLDFKVELNGSTRNVSWSPPPDPRFGGVLVARVEGQLGAGPVSGTGYAVGDTLSPGVTVVAVSGPEVTGNTMFTESMAAGPGLVRYVGWAFDDLHNYGPPAGDYVVVPMPAQTATVAVDAGAGTVTIPTPPSALTLSGEATLSGSTLSVDLTIRNDSTRVLYAPKLLLASTLSGVTWSNSDGTLDAMPYRAYGAAILPGTSATETWTFTGASGSTALSLDLEFRDNPILTTTKFDRTTAGTIVDQVTGAALVTLSAGPTGQGGDGMSRRGGMTPDGRLLFGARTAGTVSTFDLVNGNRVLTTTLRKQKAHVPQVILDKSGSAAYALVADGHPYNVNNYGGNGSDTELVRLDTATLTESGRLALGMSRNRCIDMSPDGKTLIVTSGLTSQGVFVVDLVTFTVKTQIVADFRPGCAIFTPDGASIVIVGEKTAVFSLDGTRSTSYPTPGTSGKVLRAAFGADGLLWIGRSGELVNIDLSTGMGQEFTTLGAEMLEVFDDKVYVGNGSTVTRLDAAGTVETTLPGFSSLRGHWIGRSPF